MIRQLFFICIFAMLFQQTRAQDPKLPAANLGLSNMQDGRPPGNGLYFQQFVQSYTDDHAADAAGNKLANSGKIGTLLALSQLIYISPLKVVGGNFGWTVLLPVVKIAAYAPGGSPVGTNPNSFGDIVTGPFIQWFNRKFAGMRFDHRFELDIVLPTGAWQSKYDINPGAHEYSISPHYTFTLSPTKRISVSMRQYLTYNFDQMGTDVKAGAFYNANYALEYEFLTRLRVEFAGYYLWQFAQDSKGGDSQYYQDNYGLPDTRERVLAFGPGLGYITSTGLFVEIKNMWETEVRNRTHGYRTTLVLAYKIK